MTLQNGPPNLLYIAFDDVIPARFPTIQTGLDLLATPPWPWPACCFTLCRSPPLSTLDNRLASNIPKLSIPAVRLPIAAQQHDHANWRIEDRWQAPWRPHRYRWPKAHDGSFA